MKNYEMPQRLYALDTLRGGAAIVVIFWHWQHFFYIGSDASNVPWDSQPFYPYLFALYKHGWLAVDLFFALSGYVFAWLFADKIATGKISLATYALDRISRLYPLHIVTFAAVFFLQFLYARSHTAYFVFQLNDLYHAFLNLFLIPAWGFEKGWSFNAPIWSVSVEVFLYIAFGVGCLLGRARLLAFAVLIAIGYLLPEQFGKIAVGLREFFTGGFVYFAISHTLPRMGARSTAGVWTALALIAWVYAANYGVSDTSRYIIFPATVGMFAAIGIAKRNFLKNGAWLGDISYSVYLLHFPLQIVFAIVCDRLGYQRTVLLSPFAMAAFFAILIPVAAFTFVAFEHPTKNWLRANFLRHRQTSPAE
ncbi:acyltransferase family protein [Rhizobium sp. NPDC090279]|uniref:acyltransferase family protein n=1 Tax=Rhizobium sp. NPDC090279 TaxID=3364499 RepID=UPI003839E1B9